MVTLTASITALPGKEALLAEECIRLAEKVRKNEKGCLMYIPHVSTDNPAEITFFEKYIDQESFEIHSSTQYFKEFKENLRELVSGDSKLTFMKELI